MPDNGRPDAAAPGYEITEKQAEQHTWFFVLKLQVECTEQDSCYPYRCVNIPRPANEDGMHTAAKKDLLYQGREQTDKQQIEYHAAERRHLHHYRRHRFRILFALFHPILQSLQRFWQNHMLIKVSQVFYQWRSDQHRSDHDKDRHQREMIMVLQVIIWLLHDQVCKDDRRNQYRERGAKNLQQPQCAYGVWTAQFGLRDIHYGLQTVLHCYNSNTDKAAGKHRPHEQPDQYQKLVSGAYRLAR